MDILKIIFKDFYLFAIVYGIVFVDAAIAILFAVYDKRLDWSCIPNYIKKSIKYSGFLIFGNLIDHVASLDTNAFSMLGVIPIFASIVIAEFGSFRKKFLTENVP